ncbi:hypothetical protein VNO77_26846 [Canavalia gladiata]|uniref:Uncharacterized protein n=1 Tax=Canavalia gladiata TaxID=3824 RepID=A0AAN9Q6M5_CANGL
MVQRKVPNKLGIQAEHVKSDKHLANLKLLSSYQHQDGKSRGADMKKKMKKSRSIKFSDIEALQSSSSPSRRSLSEPAKPPPIYAPTTSASPQKQQPLFRRTEGSPNYMKPTSSSHAKKELFPVSHRNTQSSPDFNRKFSSDSKAACVKKPAKTLTRSSSLSLVRTLTKTTSFKASRACPRKSTRTSLYAPQTATCSSTLKDSKFPAYLMLSPGGTESKGTSVMKVCPYTYCSLNGHHHDDLPSLKSFMSSRRRLLKTQKRAKLEALKVPLETHKEDSDVEQNVYDAKPACDEIGIDIFVEIYANEKRFLQPTEMGKIGLLKEIEDQEDIKSTIEEGVMQVVTPRIIDIPSLPKSEIIDLEEDLKNSIDEVAIELDTKGDFLLQEQNAEEVDEDHQPIVWFHEEMSMGSYCSDEDQHMDDSDSKAYDTEWEEERVCGFGCGEDADSSMYTEEDNDSKTEYSSESSHDVSVTWLDDILCSYYEDFQTLKEANSEENTYFEEQPNGISSVLEDPIGSTETQEIGYSSTGMGCDQSSLTDVTFEYITNAEGNGEGNEKHMKNDDTIDNSQCEKMGEPCKIDETREDECSSSIENNDESNNEDNQIHLFDVYEESNISVQDQDLLEKDQTRGKRFQRTGCMGDEEENTSKNWKCAIRRKRSVEDDDEEMRKFNPKEPNFLPLVPKPEPEKEEEGGTAS